MTVKKILFPLGMIGVISFLMLTTLGRILWPGYNPVTTYITPLTANEAPNADLMRMFMNIYTFSFLVFTFRMTIYALKKHNILLKIGYVVLCIVAALALVGYGACPISLALIFSANGIIHMVVTVAILLLVVFAMVMITLGYLKDGICHMLGRVSLAVTVMYIFFNLLHLYAILGMINVLGLLERFVFYTFHVFTFYLSWVYTFRKEV